MVYSLGVISIYVPDETMVVIEINQMEYRA